MKVSEVMTHDVLLATPDQTISEAARMMAECDAGALPVKENDRIVGVITDRDIAVRAVAENRSCETPVGEIMSPQVLYCYEDEDIEHVAQNMGENQVRRLPVLNRSKRLVGIISLGDISRHVMPNTAGETIADISKPGGDHSQAGQAH
jgi:CBS domain-containing protein